MSIDLNIDLIVKHNLELIPTELHDIYVELVANTKQLPHFQKEGYVKLYDLIRMKHLNNRALQVLNIIEHEPSDFKAEFFRFNNILGRKDNPIHTVETLMSIFSLKLFNKDYDNDLEELLTIMNSECPLIVFADEVYSGKSLSEDFLYLKRISEYLGNNQKRIIAVVYRITHEALTLLENIFDDVIYAEIIPDSYSVFNKASTLYLYGDRGYLVQNLVQWFRENLVPEGGLLNNMEIKMKDSEIGLWGFQKKGWLISTHKNTPNNSLPILWYTPEDGKYIAPFPRVSSYSYLNKRWSTKEVIWNIIKSNIE